MPIRPPALDDRSFHDLVDELIARIPAHTPDWTNPRPGDPGVTILELFAWLADTILYRANLIPERQRLVFLSLLGMPLRPAAAARGLIGISVEGPDPPALSLAPYATIAKPVPFETLSELTVVPVEGEFYSRRTLTEDERAKLQPVIDGLRDVYGMDAASEPEPYISSPVFPGNAALPAGFDMIASTVDRCLWLGLFAPAQQGALPEALVRAADQALASGGQDRRAPLINIGVVPAVLLRKPMPDTLEDLAARSPIPFVCEVSRERDGKIEYLPLDILDDTTAGLTRQGVFRVALPAPELRKLPANDVRDDLFAGVEERPPRLDEPDKAARLVAWLRLRPAIAVQTLPLSWAGINCAEIDQRRRIVNVLLGVSNGLADQEFPLPARSVDPTSMVVEVQEAEGYRPWRRVDDLALADRDTPAFALDAEAGTIRFGDGVRGRVPGADANIRLLFGRAGGGVAGNLPPGAIQKIEAVQLDGSAVTRKLKVVQPVATTGGAEAETVLEAERRIPRRFRHQDRAVTADDYRVLTELTPGVAVGRVEVLPLFLPHQRRPGIPGVVTVMALPEQSRREPPNPRPDRPFLEAIERHLKPRRPLGVELYVIGCQYVSVGLAIGITVRDGFGRDAVALALRDALRLFLWPLAPGGPVGDGWPLGRQVREREIEATAARVPGVETVIGSNLFVEGKGDWEMLTQPPSGAAGLILEDWQLPELLGVVIATDGSIPENLSAIPNPFAAPRPEGESGPGRGKPRAVAVPVISEVC